MPFKVLDGIIHPALQRTNAYNNKQLVQPDTNGRFVRMVLAEFDRVNAPQLAREYRILSGAETSSMNTALPASYQREVIREALADLNILELVRVAIDPAATATTSIPYEERAYNAETMQSGGVVYEGQAIPFAGVGVKQDYAYITAMKLAVKVTNEVIHFSQSSGINWDAWAESIASNARVIKELISLRITNEMQRAADSYHAQNVVGEAFTATSTGKIKTVLFPIVRPYSPRDLQGNMVGNAENPIVITSNGKILPYYTGESTLADGTYWTFANINLGYIQLVNQAGQPTGDGLQGTISYSSPTNLVKFDLNLPAGTKYPLHLNDLLSAIGDGKAVLSGQRYAKPDYAVMSYMLNNEMSKAEQFALSYRRDGTATTLQGDLDSVKGLPVFDTNAPGDFGDMRILLGQRGLTSYVIAKPYSMGTPFEAVGGHGMPTGEKIAYGEEYNAIYTPKSVRNRYTSILVYDSTTR
jgi:hypothetical protein